MNFIIKLNKKRKLFLYLFCITALILLNSFVFYLDLNYKANYTENNKVIKSSTTIPSGGLWVNNPDFSGTYQPWFPQKEGDITDVDTSYTPDQANFEILGDQGTFSEVSGTPTSLDWVQKINPFFPILPDNVTIDEYGCEAAHLWQDPDDTNQTTSVHWDRIINMPVDMSDYVITSASVSAVFNASVTTKPGGAGGPNSNYGVDAVNDTYPQTGDYDSVRFYVLISDLLDNEIYEIAWYQTAYLGQDEFPEISYIADSFMNRVLEEALIFYLTSLFDRDNFHFKVTLGIRIKCIDNWNYDNDKWDSLRIKACDLTFNYKKKIDQFTKVSWNQEGGNITGANKYITNSFLTFKYKIDQPWPELLSPNAEIRILLNNNTHSETIKLKSAITEFQEAKVDGFNLTSIVLKDVNISLSIQIFLADEFLLNQTLTISIDDAELWVFYNVILEDVLGEPGYFLWLMIIAAVAASIIGGYFILYQRILKYPIPVRKVRKYRKTLNDKSAPARSITSRDSAFNKVFKKETSKTSKLLKLNTTEKSIKTSERLGKKISGGAEQK